MQSNFWLFFEFSFKVTCKSPGNKAHSNRANGLLHCYFSWVWFFGAQVYENALMSCFRDDEATDPHIKVHLLLQAGIYVNSVAAVRECDSNHLNPHNQRYFVV